MKNLPIIFAIIILSAVVGCRDTSYIQTLINVESIMAENPDSALQLLLTIPSSSLSSNDESSLYKLLVTEARYKCGYDDTLLTDVASAVKYFDSTNDILHKVKAHYYAGIIRFNRQEYGESVIELLRAEKLAKSLNNSIFLGLVYRAIADSYDKLMDWASALTYYQMSSDMRGIKDDVLDF